MRLQSVLLRSQEGVFRARSRTKVQSIAPELPARWLSLEGAWRPMWGCQSP